MDDSYVNFLTEELIPFIEERYGTSRDREKRCIVGDSLGGLIALYAALIRPETFGLVITQSGAFVPPRVLSTVCPKISDKDIFEVAAKPTSLKLRISMQWGKYDIIRWIDLYEENERIANILKERGHDVLILVVPEGHNWGNWINHLPSVLRGFFKPDL
ncbi:MAG TPA: esterase family protein [Candidatus Korarchaeota archaeon]|nr:esterase family protein [Candidatus Korarchaeota archaeon]